jgi:hypothetical protein
METGFEGALRADHPTAWLFWLVLGFTLLAGSFLQQRRAALVGWYADLWKPRAVEGRTYSSGFISLSWVLSALAAGLFALPVVPEQMRFAPNWPLWTWSALLAAAWLVFFGIQYAVHTLVGALLAQQSSFALYWTERSVGLRWTALLALPLLWGWILPSSHIATSWIFYGCAAFLYLIGIVRGMLVLIQKSTLSTVHLFAYLCTLEGAPIAWAFYGASHL